jgi:hypothetical protein
MATIRVVETDEATERALVWLAERNGMTVEQVIERWLRSALRRVAEADPELRAAMDGGRRN